MTLTVVVMGLDISLFSQQHTVIPCVTQSVNTCVLHKVCHIDLYTCELDLFGFMLVSRYSYTISHHIYNWWEGSNAVGGSTQTIGLLRIDSILKLAMKMVQIPGNVLNDRDLKG